MTREEIKLNVEHEKSTSESIVARCIGERGIAYCSPSTRENDFNGIDLIAINRKTLNKYTIDVKNSKDENRNTRNFLFTTVNGVGKSYTEKKTDFYAFLNRDTSLGKDNVEIIMIASSRLKWIIDTYKLTHYQSKHNKLSKYVLIPKTLAKKYANDIMYWNNLNVNT